MLADDDNSVGILIAMRGKATTSGLDRELTMSAGDAFIILHGEAAAMTHAAVGFKTVLVPRNTLAPLVRDVELAAMRPLPRDSEPLKLLTVYMKAITRDLSLGSPALRGLAATHVQDLLAHNHRWDHRDGAEIAGQRGVRAARLAAVKSDVTEHVGRRDLRWPMSPRVRAWRRATFKDCSRPTAPASRRSCWSRNSSRAPHADRCPLCDIDDQRGRFCGRLRRLSYFHRVYRRQYGATPAETRNDTRQQHDAK